VVGAEEVVEDHQRKALREVGRWSWEEVEVEEGEEDH